MSDLIIQYITTSAAYYYHSAPLPPHGATAWVKQAGGWVEGQLQPAGGGGGYHIVPQEEGGGMPWDEVVYLLSRLGFVYHQLNTETAEFNYLGDSRYGIRLFLLNAVPHWADADVRKLFDYAYQTIQHYEKEQGPGRVTYGQSPLERPQSRPEDVEEW